MSVASELADLPDSRDRTWSQSPFNKTPAITWNSLEKEDLLLLKFLEVSTHIDPFFFFVHQPLTLRMYVKNKYLRLRTYIWVSKVTNKSKAQTYNNYVTLFWVTSDWTFVCQWAVQICCVLWQHGPSSHLNYPTTHLFLYPTPHHPAFAVSLE